MNDCCVHGELIAEVANESVKVPDFNAVTAIRVGGQYTQEILFVKDDIGDLFGVNFCPLIDAIEAFKTYVEKGATLSPVHYIVCNDWQGVGPHLRKLGYTVTPKTAKEFLDKCEGFLKYYPNAYAVVLDCGTD